MSGTEAIDDYVPGHGDPTYVVAAYDLDLDYAISANRLDGRARLDAHAAVPLRRFAVDLAGLRVRKVTVDGAPARWQQRRDKVEITPAHPIVSGAAFVVDIRYSGNPRPAPSVWGSLGWEELTDGILVASQPSGAPTWFPCNDLARQKARYRITVTADSGYRVVAIGGLLSMRTGGSKTTWVYEQPEPAAPYLVTLHIGRYTELQVSDGSIPIRAVAPAHLRRRVLAAFDRQPEMMRVFVDAFGPYPFADGYTVVVSADPLELPLEAQGQAIFGVNHLEGNERLIAHELAHQWFGNSVTAGRWRDIWLHEGFCCYAEWIWSEASGGPSAAARARQYHEKLRHLRQDLVLGDPGPRDMFDDRVYKRGALTVHALRVELGDDAFFELLKRWTSTHRHGVVTTGQFEAMADEQAGRPLGALFDAWLRSAPLPPLTTLTKSG
jgi:aminopeptidase N